jgi:hypothetical protein
LFVWRVNPVLIVSIYVCISYELNEIDEERLACFVAYKRSADRPSVSPLSAFSLERGVDVDAAKMPYLAWHWKVAQQ